MESLRKSALLLFALNLVLPQSLFALHETGKRLPKTADLLIIGGTVVTMDGDRRVIENGALAVTADRIVAIGTSQQLKSEFSAKRVIDAGGRVVIPGLVNTHTHIPMTLFRGLADDLDLQDWLTKHIFPAEAKYVNEEMVRVGTRLGLAELVRGGTTTFNDMYYFEDAIADETRKAGIRAVLGETLIDFPAPDNKTFDDALRYTEWFVSKWKASELIYPAVAPHAPYTVSKEHLLASKALADRHGVRVHIHLAEANTETEFIRQNHQGQRPIEFVENIGFLGDKMIAAHVVQADVSELEILKRRGVGIAH
ncbi:MAG: amidohydrolase family protein, partial [Acidobacteriota bacterium]